MAVSEIFLRLSPALAIASVLLIMPVHSQIQTPCTASMLASLTPCMNFLTNSSSNGAPPTAGCCNVLKSLVSNGTDCLCLIATGSVPFQIPINRSLAISLPRACNMPGVPLQCKASAAPIPAPGPTAFRTNLAPEGPAPLSPQGSVDPESVPPALAPDAQMTPDLTPPSTTMEPEAPTGNPGSRPVLNPSAAEPPHSFSPSLVLALIGAILLKCY
ncbi:non-specific lipid transfer protein GPI-anchored 20-like [Diospyros lotus]|uniref:non-specific lipid transfer protein GPI-anchored 20-like n=1 Tax=Diospyros lotus TaxID=55363 RepID=UPI002254A526|nr:non-specific lipid transfer protein GPI-anchored 20-like [Diospyros lotus]